ENYAPWIDLADALHLAGRFEESQQQYQLLSARSPRGMIFDTFYASPLPTVRMAYGYIRAGDDNAAQTAIANYRSDMQKRMDAGVTYFSDLMAEALACSIEQDAACTFEYLRKAMA